MPLSGVAVSIGRNTYDPPAPVVPCFDVHDRTTILYNNFYVLDELAEPPVYVLVGARSGIVGFQSDKLAGYVIPSNSGAAAICTAVFIDVYNGTGALGSFPGILPLSVERVNSDSSVFYFDDTNDQIYIWASGTYEITMRYSCTQTSVGARSTCQGEIQVSGVNGQWVTVPGSYCYVYTRDTTNDEDTSMSTLILSNIQPGMAVRGYATGGATTGVQFKEQSCSITITKLE